jgi:hypothetical protein
MAKPVCRRLPRDGANPDSDDAENVVGIVGRREKGDAPPVWDGFRRTHLPDVRERLA